MDLGGGHGGSSSCTGSEHDVRERETEGKEGRGGQGEREGAASSRASLGGPSRCPRKQEVATAGSWEPPRRCSTKRTRTFCKKALGLQGFSRNFRNRTDFAIFVDSKGSKS
jgi:hypothetical protein